MNPFRLALLGAPGTGKTRLAAELATALASMTLAPGQRLVVVEDDPAGKHLAGEARAVSATASGLAAFDLILLMGLDLDSCGKAYETDAAIRTLLATAGLPFRVVYGRGEERLRNALAAISSTNAKAVTARRLSLGDGGQEAAVIKSSPARWIWSCDKCSDPACEYALFTNLRIDRADRVARAA